MALVALIVYFVILLTVACFAILWSDLPEMRGGWFLSRKHKLPPAFQLWHPKFLLPFYVLCGLLVLLLTYLDYQAAKDLIWR